MGTTTPDYPKGITFEQVWAALKDTDRQMKETDRKIQENAQQIKETDQNMQKLQEQMRRTDRAFGYLGNRFGEMLEYMVMPNMLDKFWELGFVFTKGYHDFTIKDENRKFIAQVDITLENGDIVMLVEVKSKPITENVIEHVERIEKIRIYANSRNDKRKYMGAIAGMIINDNVKQFAFKNGFYVIEPSGETFNILVPEDPYSPREW